MAVGILLSCWRPVAYFRGALAARFDEACGRDGMVSVPYWTPWDDDYHRLLNARYGATDQRPWRWATWEEVVGYADGYNAVAYPRLRAKYGQDIFAECYQEAKENWYAKVHQEAEREMAGKRWAHPSQSAP